MNEQKKMKFIFPPIIKAMLVHESEQLLPVGKIYCVGGNYEDHAKEMGGMVDRDRPFFFSKPPQSISQSSQISFPTQTNDLQHEVELVVLLGSRCSNVEVGQAHEHIFGYAVGVDLTKRDLQKIAKDSGKPWDLSKGFDDSAPISTVLKCEKKVLREGKIELAVNGITKQSSNISNMVWQVDEIISWLSKFITLKQGDIIFTGTPAGVGKLKLGDKIDASIEGIGRLSFSLN